MGTSWPRATQAIDLLSFNAWRGESADAVRRRSRTAAVGHERRDDRTEVAWAFSGDAGVLEAMGENR